MDIKLEEQKKKVLFRLEQLIGETEYKKRKVDVNKYEWLDGYEEGVTAAYIIVKRILEGGYE